MVELCFLEAVLHQSIDTLSKGYQHRTCLAQSLIHDPEVLIMDEPTDGLDPEPEARGAQPDPQHGREQGDRVLHPHPGGGRGGLLARHHHRPRPHRRERHAGGAARHARTWPARCTLRARGTAPRAEKLGRCRAHASRTSRRRVDARLSARQVAGRRCWRARWSSCVQPRRLAAGRACTPRTASSTKCSAASPCPTR